MTGQEHLQFGLLVWVAALVAAGQITLRRHYEGVGLILIYLANLWLIHWPGAALYALPHYYYYDARTVEIGFEQSVWAVVAFLVGVVITEPLARLLFGRGRKRRSIKHVASPSAQAAVPVRASASADSNSREMLVSKALALAPANIALAPRSFAPRPSVPHQTPAPPEAHNASSTARTRRRTILLDARGALVSRIYVLVGLVSYFVIYPFSSSVPSLTAFSASLNQLLIVGLGLGCWHAWYMRARSIYKWLGLACGLPLLTTIFEGFAGFGVVALITVVIFVATFFRPRRYVVALALILVYGGMSGFVTYMRDRQDIRESVWGGNTLEQRAEVLLNTLSSFEWFDVNNENHLRSVDDRLNQNHLVGATVEKLSSGGVDYAFGATLGEAALAMVPRAVWPDKPTSAGSGSIVSTYTGLTFAQGTAVGVGQVMEFYINFGAPGVLCGFLLLGGVIAHVDRKAGLYLRRGDLRRFTLWYLPSLALLLAGNSFSDIALTISGAVVTAHLVTHVLSVYLQRRGGTA